LRFLLDTNILSEPLFPTPDRRVLERLREHGDEVATASVVWHELLFGYHRLPPSARREAIGQYLEEVVEPSIAILPYDARAAQWHAAERARLGAEGRTPPFADGQIAAVASVNGLAVVTANTTDYADFRDLEVVDWHS
jgi:tRNA(fMet)-specific endonuclease VapC